MDFSGRTAAQSTPKIRTVGFNIEGSSPPIDSIQPAFAGRTSMPTGSPSPVIIPAMLQAHAEEMHRSTSGLAKSDCTGTEDTYDSEEQDELELDDADQLQPLPPMTPLHPPAPVPMLRASASTVGMDAVIAAAGGTGGSFPASPGASFPPEPTAAVAADTGKGKSGSKGPPPGDKEPKPKLTRAERREIQERQRAEKEVRKASELGGGGGAKIPPKAPPPSKAVPPAAPATPQVSASVSGGLSRVCSAAGTELGGTLESVAATAAVTSSQRKDLFSHLPQYHAEVTTNQLLSKAVFGVGAGAKGAAEVPPAAVELGMKYLSGQIRGGAARCVAMLRMLQVVVREYTTPPRKTLSRDLTLKMNHIVQFLIDCRPMSVSMGNAIRAIKLHIAATAAHVPPLSESEVKAMLIEDIEGFIQEKIVFADRMIASHAVNKIADGDVVLTYAHSGVVLASLLEAHRLGRRFRVVVVNSRPLNEGRKTLTTLLEAGLSCQYIHLNALAYIMREVTKVFLGAAAVTANGTVVSRTGTAAVAMVAHEWRIPVMICCETCKFQEKVQLDSICSNELGNPVAVATVQGKPELRELHDADGDAGGLHVVNLMYDAMPMEYITMIITEFGMIPPTSVPVIIREYRKEPWPVAV